MSDFEKLSRELLSGDKASKLEKVVNSEEGQRIGKMIDGNALKKAAVQGDKDTVSKILGQVLATEDGKALVKKISESFGK